MVLTVIANVSGRSVPGIEDSGMAALRLENVERSSDSRNPKSIIKVTIGGESAYVDAHELVEAANRVSGWEIS